MGIEVIKDLHSMGDTGDEWGHAIGFLFSISVTLYLRDECIPDAWKFVPAPGMTEENARSEDFSTDYLLTEYDVGTINGDDLCTFGEKLNQECDELEAAGKSY